MRPRLFWLAMTTAALAGCARRATPARDEGPAPVPAPAPAPVHAHAPIAVVELFTSEGCSSCPPADRHLAEIEASAATQHENVFVLSFHVDYWNHLGWKDPFSDERHSERQRNYARVVGDGQLYTPQMIVNGREAFVGTARSTAGAAIQRALSEPAAVAITLAPRASAGQLLVDYRLDGDTRDLVLDLAITEPAPGVAVARGENAGHTLSHRGVVRAFVSRELSGQTRGSAALDLPPGVTPGQAKLVGYVTNRRSLAIVGASAVPLATSY
jgi:hypothetical protein